MHTPQDSFSPTDISSEFNPVAIAPTSKRLRARRTVSLTLPTVSYITGNTVNRRIYEDSNHTKIVGSVLHGRVSDLFDWNMLPQPPEGPLTLYLASKRSEILEWISTFPYRSHHRRISENCLEGTGQWVLEKEEYRNWRSPSVSMLLLLRVSVRYCMPPSLDGLSS